ncbi:Membrane-spanning 4-domains subfamily A member 8 [Oryzias melastigma]|uniref:Membrane-spanning 4-domains subfamily A member 8 n=1 Tax=Oryzias melastigma TaxID=30732 RepID=A0A834CHJ6_ORYME|nr:Membrane-spanning 4-domains subfamily A member 8 [Oryzias melastigma]
MRSRFDSISRTNEDARVSRHLFSWTLKAEQFCSSEEFSSHLFLQFCFFFEQPPGPASMSVAMSRADGVTILTVTSDPRSPWPPLCQVVKSLCCHPACCSVSRQLRSIQRSSLSVLGAVQVMVGLLHIGLGAVLTKSLMDLWWLRDTGFPYWTGVLCVVFGSVCILSETIHSPCLVLVNVMLNVAGAAFAVTAIVLYSIIMTEIYLRNICRENYYDYGTTPSPGSVEAELEMRCLEGRRITMMIQRSINSFLIVLSVLQLCVTISCAVVSITALCGVETKSESSDDLYKPLLEDVSAEPAV